MEYSPGMAELILNRGATYVDSESQLRHATASTRKSMNMPSLAGDQSRNDPKSGHSHSGNLDEEKVVTTSSSLNREALARNAGNAAVETSSAGSEANMSVATSSLVHFGFPILVI